MTVVRPGARPPLVHPFLDDLIGEPHGWLDIAHQFDDQVTARAITSYGYSAECMQGEGYPMIGSHDPVVIEEAMRLARASGRTTTDYEIQMLYGIRADEQTRLHQQGILVRVYVPYGSDWYGYFTRRLAERPANLLFFLRALTARGQMP